MENKEYIIIIVIIDKSHEWKSREASTSVAHITGACIRGEKPAAPPTCCLGDSMKAPPWTSLPSPSSVTQSSLRSTLCAPAPIHPRTYLPSSTRIHTRARTENNNNNNNNLCAKTFQCLRHFTLQETHREET